MNKLKVPFKNMLVIIVIGYLFVNFITSQFTLVSKRNELKDLREQQNQLTLEVDNMQRLMQEEDLETYIERVARERFGYASPDDKVFIDIQSEE